jgi:formylglycine-generating enzyme required for sulfatase activity
MKTKGTRIVLATGVVAVVFLGLAVWLGWPYFVFWHRFAPLGMNAQGFPEYRHRQTGIVFVRLPGGKFWMGAQGYDPNGRNYDPKAQENEGPVHEVALSPFLIGKYEVTRDEWKQAGGTSPIIIMITGSNVPMGLSWNDVQEFKVRTGLFLPSEAQWEYACRAGNTTSIADIGTLDSMAWYEKNSGMGEHSIGGKAPNRFGLHDMLGNVWELCEDAYDAEFFQKTSAAGPNPVSKEGSEDRVVRGGSCTDSAQCCRSTHRFMTRPKERKGNFGFRPAYRIP